MPYIETKDRKRLDPLVDRLAEELMNIDAEYEKAGERVAFAGNLNYVITRLAAKFALKNLRYRTLSQINGILHDVANEFYRRVVARYEDKQIKKHGDVDIYAEIEKRIEES
jgi:hypothetical protein